MTGVYVRTMRTEEYRRHLSAAAKKQWAVLGAREERSAVMMGNANSWKGGRAMWIYRQNAKRRLLGFVFLNVSFPECEGHHIDNERVIYIPKELHRSVYHRQSDGWGMAQINAVAYNFLFRQEVEAAIVGASA